MDIKETVRQAVNKLEFVKCLITEDATIEDFDKSISLIKEVISSLENIKGQIGV